MREYLLSDFGDMYESLKDKERAGDINYFELETSLEHLYEIYSQALKLVFSKKTLSFCYLTLVDSFNEAVEEGGFNAYDGQGDYIDFEGNVLGDINWQDIWNYPKDTVFVAWYNK